MRKTIQVKVDELFMKIYAENKLAREFYDMNKEEYNFLFFMRGEQCVGYKLQPKKATEVYPKITFVYPLKFNIDRIIRKNIAKKNFVENITNILKLQNIEVRGDISAIEVGKYKIVEVNGKQVLILGEIPTIIEKEEVQLLDKPVVWEKKTEQQIIKAIEWKHLDEKGIKVELAKQQVKPEAEPFKLEIGKNETAALIEKAVIYDKGNRWAFMNKEEPKIADLFIPRAIVEELAICLVKPVKTEDELCSELFYNYQEFLQQEQEKEIQQVFSGQVNEEAKGMLGSFHNNKTVFDAKLDVAEWCLNNFQFPKSKLNKIDTLRTLYKNQVRINIHEIINGPANLYCDIDCEKEEEFNHTINTINSDTFRKFFKITYAMIAGQVLKKTCQIHIEVVKSTKLDVKLSAHIYIRVFIKDVRITFEDQKLFWELAAKNMNLSIDMAVYKKNARMRTIFSSKDGREFAPIIETEEDLYKYMIVDSRNSFVMPDLKKSIKKMSDIQENKLKLELKYKCITRHHYEVAMKALNKEKKDKLIEDDQKYFVAKDTLKQNVGKFARDMKIKVEEMEGSLGYLVFQKSLNEEKWTEYEKDMLNDVIEYATIYKGRKTMGYIFYKQTVRLLYLMYLRYELNPFLKENEEEMDYLVKQREHERKNKDGSFFPEKRIMGLSEEQKEKLVNDISGKINSFFNRMGFNTHQENKENTEYVKFLVDQKYNNYITYTDIREHFKPSYAKKIINYKECIYPPVVRDQKFVAVCRAFCNMKKTVNLLLLATGKNIYETVLQETLREMFGDIVLPKQEKIRLLVITSRKTLADNFVNNTCGVEFAHYEEYKRNKRTDIPENFVVQLESLGKFSFIDQYDLVFIDEAPHFINQFCHLKEQKAHCKYYTELEGIFRRMFEKQSVIFSSANINKEVYKFIELFNQKIDYDFFFDVKVRAGWKVKNYEDKQSLVGKVLRWLAAGENLFIGSFSKTHSRLLKDLILSTDPYTILPYNMVKSKPITESDILIINGDSDNSALFTDMKNNFKKRVVIYTSSMSVGVSFTEENWFHRNIVFCQNNIGQTSDEAYQMAFRNRNPIIKKVYINMVLYNVGFREKYDFQKKVFFLECPYQTRFLLDRRHYYNLKTEGLMNQVYINNKMYMSWDLMNFAGNLRGKFEEEGFIWENKTLTTDVEEIERLKRNIIAIKKCETIRTEIGLKEYFSTDDWSKEGCPYNREYEALSENHTKQEIDAIRKYYIANFDKIEAKRTFFRTVINNELVGEALNILECKLDNCIQYSDIFEIKYREPIQKVILDYSVNPPRIIIPGETVEKIEKNDEKNIEEDKIITIEERKEIMELFNIERRKTLESRDELTDEFNNKKEECEKTGIKFDYELEDKKVCERLYSMNMSVLYANTKKRLTALLKQYEDNNEIPVCNCKKECININCIEFDVKGFLPKCILLKNLDKHNRAILKLRYSLSSELKVMVRFLNYSKHLDMTGIYNRYTVLLDTIEFTNKHQHIGKKKSLKGAKPAYIIQSINKYIEKSGFKFFKQDNKIVFLNNIVELVGNVSIDLENDAEIEFHKKNNVHIKHQFFNQHKLEEMTAITREDHLILEKRNKRNSKLRKKWEMEVLAEMNREKIADINFKERVKKESEEFAKEFTEEIIAAENAMLKYVTDKEQKEYIEQKYKEWKLNLKINEKIEKLREQGFDIEYISKNE